ncbi:hypothetical protein COB87_001050 [Candidatus Wolfebacteria bacterium]|nr:hypothetical protein [Candidatus Wolfebacteria bacterium]
MSDLQTLIKEQLPNIPPQIKNYLHSDAYPQVMQNIVANHDLHLDIAAKIEIQTTLLLIGLISPNEYEQRLIHVVGISKEQANKIAHEMNEKIFKPIVESYKKPLPEAVPNVFADEEAIEGPHKTPEEPTVIAVENHSEPKKEKKIEKKYAIDPYREPIE